MWGFGCSGSSEPALGVQGQGGCDSQHGRQGNHFPKKPKVSSVSPNPSPWGHSLRLQEFTGRSSCGTTPGCHGTTTQQTLGHLWWPRGFNLAQTGNIDLAGGEGSKTGHSKQGMRLLLPPGLLVVQGRRAGAGLKMGSPSPKSRVKSSSPVPDWDSWRLLGTALPLWPKVGIHLPGLLLLCLSCCVEVPVW